MERSIKNAQFSAEQIAVFAAAIDEDSEYFILNRANDTIWCLSGFQVKQRILQHRHIPGVDFFILACNENPKYYFGRTSAFQRFLRSVQDCVTKGLPSTVRLEDKDPLKGT